MNQKSTLPNFLFIICDDLAVGDLSLNGNPFCRTPHLDQMAAAGLSAQRHLSGPLCSPARACIMTGRYHYRSRVIDTYCGRSIMDPAERTMAEVLRDHGYRTGCFGKWHLGDTAPFRPEDRGFSETLWHLGGGIGQPGDLPENYDRESYWDPVLMANGEKQACKGYCTDVITEGARRFIETNSGAPWFAYIGFNAPHTPLQVDLDHAAQIAERGATGDLPALYAMVESIDSNVGRLLRALDDSGQADNTVVVFTSDHGPCPGVRDGSGKLRFNCGLRGYKGTPYEGGIRVPAIWRWPAGIPSGSVLDEPTHAIDIMPTFMEMAGCSASLPSPLDGISLQPLLSEKLSADEWPERVLFLQWHRGDVPVRGRHAMACNRRYKWVSLYEGDAGKLFDIQADAMEANDLTAIHPAIAASLRESYMLWYDSVSSPHHYQPVAIPLTPAGEPLYLTRQDWRVLGADGWSDNTRAGWWLDIAGTPMLRATVLFHQTPIEEGSVVLTLGDLRQVVPIVEGQHVYDFTVKAPTGRQFLECSWHSTFSEARPFSVSLQAEE